MTTKITKSKTTLTVTTTLMELRACLNAYQEDMIQEIVNDVFRHKDTNTVSARDAAKFGVICMRNKTEFADLVKETGTPWVPTPRTAKAWVQLFIDMPFIFGITDDEVTLEVDEVILYLDSTFNNVTALLKNI